MCHLPNRDVDERTDPVLPSMLVAALTGDRIRLSTRCRAQLNGQRTCAGVFATSYSLLYWCIMSNCVMPVAKPPDFPARRLVSGCRPHL